MVIQQPAKGSAMVDTADEDRRNGSVAICGGRKSAPDSDNRVVSNFFANIPLIHIEKWENVSPRSDSI